jgi:UDP-glucose 4-epimerase
MKILLTGGCGFIGSNIAEKLVNLGHEVIIVDNLSSGKEANIAGFKDKVQLYIKDIRSIDASFLKGVDCILHQAALRTVPKSFLNPKEFYEVNVIGTLNLILAAKESGVKKIVLASSSSVYGEQSLFPVKESMATNPISPYADSKLSTEHIAAMFSSKEMPIVCLRYFNIFGIRQALDDEYSAVIPKFITKIKNNDNPIIFGDGEQKRDFTYIDDVVSANIQAMYHGNGVYNIGNGKPKSINQLYRALNIIMGKEIRPEYAPARKGDIRKSHAGISKAIVELNWKPKISFEEGLKRTVKWHLEN